MARRAALLGFLAVQLVVIALAGVAVVVVAVPQLDHRPDVAAQVAAYVNYVCPVQGAKEEMEKIDPELAKSEWIFPTDEILNNSQVFRPLTPEEQAEYAEAFGRVIQG